MPSIQMGSRPPNSIVVGNNPATGMPAPAREIYLGSQKIWPALTWVFEDNFNRPNGEPGPNWQNNGVGAWINNNQLRRNGNPGEGTIWTAQQFGTDDLVVEVVLGAIDASDEFSAIKIGSGSNYVSVDYHSNETKAVYYDGASWVRIKTLPTRTWSEGDTLRVSRTGTDFEVHYNGNLLDTFTDGHGIGPEHRRVALTTNMSESGNVITTQNYSPAFDSVRVGEQ